MEERKYKDEKAPAPEEKKPFTERKPMQLPKRMGKIANIIPGQFLIIDVGGNGERIPYDVAKHKNLKIGDPIEL